MIMFLPIIFIFIKKNKTNFRKEYFVLMIVKQIIKQNIQNHTIQKKGKKKLVKKVKKKTLF